MSTPLVASSAAIVRQYFTEGYYPTGSKVSQNEFNPMGALIKATIINSGYYLKGKYAGDWLPNVPSNAQGFGLVKLDSTLKINGFTNTPDSFQLFVHGDHDNMPTISNNGETDTYIYQIPSTLEDDSRVRVTLVYSDAPATLGSVTQLVNDLDLTVTFNDGSNVTTVYPNAQSEPDRLNTVEQVELKREEYPSLFNQGDGKFTITVRGHSVPQGPQPYALVISGSVQAESSTPRPTSPPSETAPPSLTLPPTISAASTFTTTTFLIASVMFFFFNFLLI